MRERGTGGVGLRRGGSRVRSSLHLSPLSPIRCESRKEETQGKRDFWIQTAAAALRFPRLRRPIPVAELERQLPIFRQSNTCWCCVNIFLGVLWVRAMSIIAPVLCVAPRAACQLISWLSGKVASTAAG